MKGPLSDGGGVASVPGLRLPGNGATVHPPFVSVLLPVRNETTDLAECTASIREQTYPAELTEIIVADASDKPHDPRHLRVGTRSVSVLRNERIVIAPGL